MSIAGNRRRLHAHERRTAAALAAAYGPHRAVRDHAAAIPVDATPTDPHLTGAVFAFAGFLTGYRFTARSIIQRAQQIAAEQGRQDATDLVGAITADGPAMADGGEDGIAANSVDQIAQNGPHRLAAALMARLGLGGYAGAAADALGGVLAAVLLTSRQAIIDAYRAAQHSVFAQAPDVNGWVWTSALAPNTCGFCYAMHGTWHPDTELLISHPFCVPAGTLAAGPRTDAATSREYHGRLLTIITTLGHNLSITPNHPVLTARGWVEAGRLVVGDEVVSSTNPDRVVTAIDPDHYQPETLIEQVAAALTVAGGVASVGVPQSAEDFHGDGSPEYEVDVVRAARLGDRDRYATREQSGQVSLVDAADTTRAGFRAARQGLWRVPATATSFLSGCRIRTALVCGHPRVPYALGVAAASLLNPGPMQGVDDRSPAHAEALRERLHGLPGLVSRDYISDITVRDDWSGHVYNLQTEGGWYAANGIVVHNCQCVQVPTSLSAAEYQATDPTFGTDLFAALDAGQQKAILGPGRYAIYAAGTPLRKMIGGRGLKPLHALRRSA